MNLTPNVWRRCPWFPGALMGAALFLFSEHAHAVRCDGGVVTVGDSQYEVLAKCGDPAFREVRQVEKVRRITPDEVVRWTVDITEWVYDFGPTRFIQVLVFEHDTLRHIRQGSYGKRGPVDGQVSLPESRKVQRGDTKYEVLVKLGQPVHEARREVEQARRLSGSEVFVEKIVVDEWTFDLGPNRFIRMVRFHNGRVVEIEHGGYGAK